MKWRNIGSPGWSLVFPLLMTLLVVALALMLPLIKLLLDWIRGQ
jgi:hypothetical protein